MEPLPLGPVVFLAGLLAERLKHGTDRGAVVELVEAAYWHPSRSDDPAVRWLVRTLQEAAGDL